MQHILPAALLTGPLPWHRVTEQLVAFEALGVDLMADRLVARRPPGGPTRTRRQLIVDAAASAVHLDIPTMREVAARLGISHLAPNRLGAHSFAASRRHNDYTGPAG